MKMNNISTSGGLTSHLVVVVQPCMKYIPIKKIVSYLIDNASLIEMSKILFISVYKNVTGLITQYIIKEKRIKKLQTKKMHLTTVYKEKSNWKENTRTD